LIDKINGIKEAMKTASAGGSMKVRGILLIIISVFLAGCAGREPNPISCYAPGDEKLSCESLKQEISLLQSNMLALLPKTDKSFTNTLWAAGGVAVTVPYFFIDMKDAERIEYEAFRRRHNRLLLIAQEKGCCLEGIRAEPIPALWQQKSQGERSNGKIVKN
jgi:hypothetical protein